MPTDFLDFPLELRNQVYHALWQHTPGFGAFYDAGSSVRIWHTRNSCKDWQSGEATALPSWLLVCKQVLQEGVAEFQFGSYWEIKSDCDWDIRDARKPKPGLFRLAEARHLYIIFTNPCDEFLYSDSPAPSHAPTPEEAAVIVRYASKASRAKDISVSFMICDEMEDYKEVDLSNIDGAAVFNSNLTKFTAVVDQCCSSKLGRVFEQSCAAEVKRLGMSMMGAVTEPIIQEDEDEMTFTVHRLPSST